MSDVNPKDITMCKRILFCTFLVLALVATSAGATGGRLSSFETAYPAAVGTRIDACLLCHVNANPNNSPSTRNSYGTAYAGAGHNFASIASADSDGDGFTNLVEINAHSFPGNAADKPVGSVQVTLEPQGARDGGAQWRLGPGGAYQDSGVMVTAVVVGAKTIQFKPVTGWVTPADQAITVVANQIFSATGTYTREQATVPNVVGQTQAGATATLTAAHLVVGLITQEYSATIPSGQVISQSPAAGLSVLGGSAVSLKVSKGPQPVTVPNVVGQNQATATTAITGAGLVVGAVTQRHDATVPNGQIISQTPAAGAQAPPGSAVGLLISQGPGLVTVPDVAGQTQAAATTVITNAGLVPGTILQEYSATVPAGRVASQTPSANAQADAGSAVALVLSQGAQPVPVPDVVGLTQDAATAAITAAGMTVGQVNETPNDTVPPGSVISQTPAAGTLAVPSSLVNLLVSSGPQSTGCACLSGQKDAFSFDGITKMLGDLFLVGLSLITLQMLAHRKM